MDSTKAGIIIARAKTPQFQIHICHRNCMARHHRSACFARRSLTIRAFLSRRFFGADERPATRGDSGFAESDAALHNINLVAPVSLTIFHSVDLDGEAPNTDPASRVHKKYRTAPGQKSSGFQRRGPIHWSRHKLRLDYFEFAGQAPRP